MKLSIIIPVYKVEKYIEKCLLSCLKQDVSYEDYEIIVINDGSPDNSLVIAKRIANLYSNIRIINQENQGLSGARNTGIKYAVGEYIWFIDSDDYIEENCLGRIVSYLKDGLDILQLQYRLVYENKRLSVDGKVYKIDGIRTGIEIMKQGGLPVPAPFSILRLKFIRENNLQFVVGIYHEDCEFKPRVTYLANKIQSDTIICYNYLQRDSGSITSSFKVKNGLDLLKVNNLLLDFIRIRNVPHAYKRYFYNQIAQNMNSLFLGFRLLPKDDKVQLFNQLKINKQLFATMAKSNILKYRLEGVIFYINVKMGLFLHNKIR